MPLVRALSDIIERVHAIVQFIRDHGPYDFDVHSIQGEAPSVQSNATKYGVAIFYAVRVHHHKIHSQHPKWMEYCKLAEDLNLRYDNGRWT